MTRKKRSCEKPHSETAEQYKENYSSRKEVQYGESISEKMLYQFLEISQQKTIAGKNDINVNIIGSINFLHVFRGFSLYFTVGISCFTT